MLKAEIVNFEDLTEEEQEFQPNNGSGKECAHYVKLIHSEKTLIILSDAAEPEDATFTRDFSDVLRAIKIAYEMGLKDSQCK